MRPAPRASAKVARPPELGGFLLQLWSSWVGKGILRAMNPLPRGLYVLDSPRSSPLHILAGASSSILNLDISYMSYATKQTGEDNNKTCRLKKPATANHPSFLLKSPWNPFWRKLLTTPDSVISPMLYPDVSPQAVSSLAFSCLLLHYHRLLLSLKQQSLIIGFGQHPKAAGSCSYLAFSLLLNLVYCRWEVQDPAFTLG